tara:strand:- start:2739 stop:2861 length:123 start_codon:yes stop_codon:yes gene_type:complete
MPLLDSVEYERTVYATPSFPFNGNRLPKKGEALRGVGNPV